MVACDDGAETSYARAPLRSPVEEANRLLASLGDPCWEPGKPAAKG